MTYLTSLSRLLACAGSLAALSIVSVACSSVDTPATVKGADSPSGKERDTKIVHEPCDGESSSAKKVDIDGRGKPGIIHVMNGSREVCRIVDLNLDGAVDSFIYYDEQGRIRRTESDFDRDGRADEIGIYNGGVLVQKQRETNFDDKLDTWDYYEGDRLARRERDSDADGIVDQWWTFNNPTNPKCAVVATDANADGKPDPDSVVDLCGEQYGAPKATPAPDAGAPAAAASATPAASAASSSAPTSAPPSATPSATPSAKPDAKPPAASKGM